MPNDDPQLQVADIVRLLDENLDLYMERWHWFQYHARRRSPFIVSIALACCGLARISSDAPQRMFRELGAIGGRDRSRPDYDQLIQKLCEILVLQQVCAMPWSREARLEIEGAAPGSPRRVDCVVTLPSGERLGFEVKAPAYLEHADRRGRSGMQLSARGPDAVVDAMRGMEDNIVLPRDNTVRDFLRSANGKFAAFKAAGPFTGILVVCWDDFIYEAISALVHDRVGLLTPNSYSRQGDGPELFPNVDAVVLLRHLNYFVSASAEQHLPDDREHCMHLGGHGALPNVIVPLRGGLAAPDFVAQWFNARRLGDPEIVDVADYLASDLVLWQRF
jgi:hypothetical protein